MSSDLTVAPETAPAPYSHEAAAKAMDVIEAALGGRRALLTALLAAPPDSSLDYVIGAIADPRSDARKLSTICANGKISLGEVLEAFKRGVMAPVLAQVMQRVASATPAVIEDVLTRSVPYEDTCPNCGGKGSLSQVVGAAIAEVPCGPCAGTGKVLIQPDFARQKYVLSDLAQLGPQRGPSVVIDQRDQSKHLSMDVSQQAHAKLLAAADRVLYGRRGVEADVDSVAVPIDSAAEIRDTPANVRTDPAGDSVP